MWKEGLLPLQNRVGQYKRVGTGKTLDLTHLLIPMEKRGLVASTPGGK